MRSAAATCLVGRFAGQVRAETLGDARCIVLECDFPPGGTLTTPASIVAVRSRRGRGRVKGSLRCGVSWLVPQSLIGAPPSSRGLHLSRRPMSQHQRQFSSWTCSLGSAREAHSRLGLSHVRKSGPIGVASSETNPRLSATFVSERRTCQPCRGAVAQ